MYIVSVSIFHQNYPSTWPSTYANLTEYRTDSTQHVLRFYRHIEEALDAPTLAEYDNSANQKVFHNDYRASLTTTLLVFLLDCHRR